MDKFIGIFKINRKFYIFLFVLLILGVLFGSILPIFLSNDDKKLVSEYLIGFIDDIKNGVDFLFLFKNGLISNFLFCFIIFLFGISIIGIPIVLVLFFYRCFIIGFSMCSIIINYGFKGILFGFLYVFPHYVISLLLYLVIVCYSLMFSIRLLLYILKRTEFNIRAFFKRYFFVFVICMVCIFICVIYESFVSPYILGFVFKLLGM